ncbi:MAG: hypothetical protein ACOYOK_13040 [Pseudobdellovibrionaceae bacterium]
MGPCFFLAVLVFIFNLVTLPLAQARVFNLKNEKLAAYFLVNAGTSKIKQAAFENESATTTTYGSQVNSNLLGEFGFFYTSGVVGFRFGFEILHPLQLNDVQAQDASGSTLYTFSSDLTGYAPKLGLDINLFTSGRWRFFAFGSYSSMSMTMSNQYVMSSAGTAAFPSVSDHSVEAKGSGSEMSYGAGVETTFTDTTTVFLEGGYRNLKINGLTYSKAVTTFTGAQDAGAEVLDVSGNKRVLDFTGFYASLGFRFYIK